MISLPQEEKQTYLRGRTGRSFSWANELDMFCGNLLKLKECKTHQMSFRVQEYSQGSFQLPSYTTLIPSSLPRMLGEDSVFHILQTQ